MFRKTSRAMALCACVVALAACGGGEPPATTTPPAIITPSPAPTAIPLPTPNATDAAMSTAAAQSALASPLQSPIGTPASSTGFAPAQRSVWDTSIVGQDQMQGNCTQGSVLPAYGLVQITPSDNGIEWKNQEPQPYAMTRIAENEYQYAGPNSINDGVVTMTVKFVDAQNLTMQREFVPKNDAGCTHVHDYNGVFKWYR
jgi:hypothetical protein